MVVQVAPMKTLLSSSQPVKWDTVVPFGQILDADVFAQEIVSWLDRQKSRELLTGKCAARRCDRLDPGCF